MSDNPAKNLARRFNSMNPSVMQRPQNPPIPPTPVQQVPEQKKAGKKAVVEFTHLVQHPTGLYAVDTENQLHFLSDVQIHSVVHVKPNALYKKGDFYQIKVNDTVITLTPTDYDNNTTVYNRIIEASGNRILKMGSDIKLKRLFKEFLSTRYSEISPDFYFGWKRKHSDTNNFAFYLSNGKTHAAKNHITLDIVPDELMPTKNHIVTVNPNLITHIPYENTLAQHISDLFETIITPKIRSILFLTTHAAALYSLFSEIETSLNLGLFINCEDSKINHSFIKLFEWYGDEAILISETEASFKSLLSQRKDQPLLIKDFNCKTSNREILRTSIQNGFIPKLLSDSENPPKLQALPIVISDYHSPFCVAPEFMHLEIKSSDLSEEACSTILNSSQAFHEYIKCFIIYVQNNMDSFKKHLASAKDAIFRDNHDGTELNEQKLLALCHLIGLEKLIHDYHRTILTDALLINRLNQLISPDWYDDAFSLLSNHIYKDNYSATIRHFSDALRDYLLVQKIFDVRKRRDSKNGTDCDPNKKGVVYLLDNCVCLTKEAFTFVRESCNIPLQTLSEAFRMENVLVESNWKTGTMQTRRKVWDLEGTSIIASIYMIPISKLGWELNQSASPSVNNTAGFTLKLGEAENDQPIIFTGGHNNHILLTGKSGSGKSYKLIEMISQLPEQGVRCIVFGSTRDFSPNSGSGSNRLPADSVKRINLKNNAYSILPFSAIYENESINFRIDRILKCISSLAKLSDKQKNHLEKALTAYISKSPATASLADFNSKLSDEDSGLMIDDTIQNIIQNMCAYLPSGSETINWELDTPGITIVQLHENYTDTQIPVIMQLLTGYIIHLRKYDSRQVFSPVVLIFDECQKLNMHGDTQVAYLLRESRKLGFAGWFSTQWFNSESVKNALGDVGTKIYFTPADNMLSEVAQDIFDVASDSSEMTTKSEYRKMLARLNVGQFVYVNNKAAILSRDPQVNSIDFSLEDILF